VAGIRTSNRTIVCAVIAAAFVGIVAVLGPWLREHGRQQLLIGLAAAVTLVAFLDPSGWYAWDRSVAGQQLRSEYTDNELALMDDAYLSESGAVAFLQSQADPPYRYFGYDQGLIWKDGRSTGGYYTSFVSDQGRLEIAWLLTLSQASRFELQDLQGYNPIQNLRYHEFIGAVNGRGQNYHSANILGVGLDSPLLDLLNARYIVVPRDVPPGRPDLLHLSLRLPTVYIGEHVRILENADAFPRAWIVHAARIGPRDWVLNELKTSPPDFRQVVLLESSPPEMSRPAAGEVESAAITTYEANKIVLTATASSPGMLVLSEVYDPGWRAYVDGKRVDLYEANYAFRAVPLPAGEHTVELRYEPVSLRAGFFISTASLFAALAYFAYLAWYRFRKRAYPRTYAPR
jgi:hypothetical protein